MKISVLVAAMICGATPGTGQSNLGIGPSAMDVTGAWAGTLEGSGDVESRRYYLRLVQSGEALTGNVQLWFNVRNGSVVDNQVRLEAQLPGPNLVSFDLVEADGVLTGTATVNQDPTSSTPITFERFEGNITYVFPIHPDPAYPPGEGPRVLVDQNHHNYTVVEGSDAPFQEFLRRDGYRVRPFELAFTSDALSGGDILIVAMPLAEENRVEEGVAPSWSRPHPSAFSEEEVTAVANWVSEGGSLLVVADHPPFVGAVARLAEAFGIRFSDGAARDPERTDPLHFTRAEGTLGDHPVTNGRTPEERVEDIATFGGSGFTVDTEVEPLLVLGPSIVSVFNDRDPDSPTTPIGGSLQGAVAEYGKGRVAFFGEAGMFFARLNSTRCFEDPKATPYANDCLFWPEYKENLQLLLNLLHWLSRAV